MQGYFRNKEVDPKISYGQGPRGMAWDGSGLAKREGEEGPVALGRVVGKKVKKEESFLSISSY